MSSPRPKELSSPQSGLLGALRSAVRSEFKVDVYLPDPDDPVLGKGRCEAAGCPGPGWSRGLCSAHHAQWRRAGRPHLESFVLTALPRRGRGARTHESYDLRALLPQVRLEIAYGLQCRHDERGGGVEPRAVAQAVELLAADNAGSILERPIDQWLLLAQQRHRNVTHVRAFLRHCYGHVEDLANRSDLAAAYVRDVWDARRLGLVGRGGYTVRFDHISQDWLKAAAKRWARFRLATGRSISTIRNDVLAIDRFSAFVAHCCPDARSESVLTRRMLEEYLSWLANSGLAARTRLSYLVSLRGFLEQCRRHGWLPGLAAKAKIYRDDLPVLGDSVPRFIPEYVMAQMESEVNLGRIPDPTVRHLVIVLIETGLRAGDACALPLDSMITDGSGSPCLAFLNSKVRAEQLVPLSEKAAAAIRAQQNLVRLRWPVGASWLFPRRMGNPDGARSFVYGTLNVQLLKWQEEIGLHDESGRQVRVTAHRFRHTLGTRLINADVPQHIVQKLLGHASPEMTATYAHLHDATLRKAFDAYQGQRVNIAGERLGLDPLAPTADAEWVKHNLARVRDSLPNGYCGRPPQQECPHPNACLTCPDFQTTPEFLPVHRQQRDNTRVLITVAEVAGQLRLAASHRRVAESLERIIPALELIEASQAGAGDAR